MRLIGGLQIVAIHISQAFSPTIANFSQQGDFDGSGDIQFADFLLLSTNFGKSATASAVPEPNAVMLLLVGLVSLVRRRWIVSKKVWLR